MKSIIIATTNKGKFEEIRKVLAEEFDTFYSLADFDESVEVTEDSPLYAENAMKKARKIGDRFGFDTIADDSGLEVGALGGRPGIHSARYARNDSERIDRLLLELQGVPWDDRGAVFKAYFAYYIPEKEKGYVFYGDLPGYIGFERHGTGGFGFDPIFYVPALDRYLAELTTEEKNMISHRGKAVRSFKAMLNSNFFKRSRVSAP